MDEAALHPTTREQLQLFAKAPSHAICLVGPPGAGKEFTAELLAHELLGKTTDDAMYRLGSQSAIGIEEVRQLQQFLRLKKPGQAAIRRVVIIANAQVMSAEAQNALLKTLEEPPADTVFILTTDGSAGLKATIQSRAQAVRILPLSQKQAEATFGSRELSKAYHLSGGYAGLLHALLNDPEHELVAAVERSKNILQASSYERLRLVDELAKDKQSLPMLFYALQRVVGALLVKTTDNAKLKRLAKNLRSIYRAEQDLALSANPKLLLTDLFLSL